MKSIIIPLLIFITLYSSCSSSRKIDYSKISPGKEYTITQTTLDSLLGVIKKYHPNPYGELSGKYLQSVADTIVERNKSKILTAVDFTLEIRRITDLLTYNDPHLIFYPNLQVDRDFKGNLNKLKVVPFEILQIKDTLLIHKSYSEKLEIGDRILSINGYLIKEFQKYLYHNWRNFKGYLIQLQSQIVFSETYQIGLERKGKNMVVDVDGVDLSHVTGEKYCNGKLLDDYQTGYFQIKSFTYNKYIIKQLAASIEKAKKAGYKDFIIDVRGNTGGSGNRLDELFSLLTEKDSIKYIKEQYLKVSPASINDYEFLKESQMGKLIKMPDSLIFKSVPLNSKLYKGAMNYYILANKSTASTAASFVNIIQYNRIGKIVGEPLNHNSLNYGDVISKNVFQKLILSTMQYNELSNTDDGILHPDIEIPYIAKQHMQEKDPILTNLLDYISSKR